MNDMKDSAGTQVASDSSTSTQLNELSDGLLPAFTTKHFTHLPTPQSPSNLGRYVHDRPYSPESPIPNRRIGARKSVHEEETTAHPSSSISQCITPESSPHFSHNPPTDHLNPATPRYYVQSASNDYTTPKNKITKAQVSASLFGHADTSKLMSTPSSPPSEFPHHSSALSSPFMAKLSLGDSHHASPSDTQATQADDISTHSMPISTPPMSPSHSVAPQPMKAGGELDRIRQHMLEDRLTQMREAESRRPEYLKRSKRPLSEVDSSYHDDDDPDGEKAISVGIMESPHKGRRLKLFQETSEESFEESLMAGGYGRYRTADWVRQPQPIALPQNVVISKSGSPNIVSIPENVDDAPPTEKQLKKQKRMAAFRSDAQTSNKLCPVELDGKGRVLIEAPAEDRIAPSSPEPVTGKKRATNRRKRKVNDSIASKKGTTVSGNPDDSIGKPNWPDSEFPWKLRTEERLELEKAEEEERLRWIERFLDRDSDDDEEIDSTSPEQAIYGESHGKNSRHGRLSSLSRQVQSEHIARPPIPLNDSLTGGPARKVGFPSDPADARAALLAKRSVRALSFRQQRRQRELDDEDEEIVCVCHGTDDGRELVQCDACQTWYHLQCIGIRSVAELGREEDPWFCRRCVARSRSPSTEPENLLSSEPTFVPTDEEPNVRRSDTSFFQPGISDSPNWSVPRMPKTPTRGYAPSDSSRSWLDSSRGGPSTPQQIGPSVKIYSSPYDGYQYHVDESPFDPTSTPSRGIRFHAPFATPKSNGWMPRNNALFQSPSSGVRGPTNKGVNLSVHYPTSDDSGSRVTPGNEFPGRRIHYDDSPIRRAEDSTFTHRILNSPKSRPPHLPYLEESPIMRSLGSQGQREKHRDTVQRRNDYAP